ncbi:ABC transporter substrate-binding protein [Marichromatium gracile]|uniref:ABC-type transport system substrate-binding protein n=1 Tax=Marichromatium gracile TaxID=1048 RepID=A0A4V2W989_MARGR|nr:ABC transporter substrate-binding protein [Marichromatium gracile]MBK1708571.1 peptide ABC transporter substrate-binding protein [Marichromatium gracile]TCW34500.1 ABC-type transport system substrate-binding protein [Marichromatium gracile]
MPMVDKAARWRVLWRGIRVVSVMSLLIAGLVACDDRPWNDPYPRDTATSNTLYSSFGERPKHLDPARSYTVNENTFIAQIYEPPLQYHFLHRPYQLIPLALAEMPRVRFYDAAGEPLPDDAPAAAIARSEYELHVRPGTRYQPHPALARDAEGAPRYLDLEPGALAGIDTLGDFAEHGTRELVAADFAYQIKRLAAPWLHSPINGVMGEHILGFAALGERLEAADPEQARARVALLRDTEFEGVEVLDRYRLRITLEGKYPQFSYWLAMPFFAPMPWEAEAFYAQPGMRERNLMLDWYPVGTGPYMLTENNPNLRMVLERNPNFHGERYPDSGMPGDRAAGILDDAGAPLPFIDRVVYSLEKESIPRWNKFLQGYYDFSGISSDAFDQAVRVDASGRPMLTETLEARGVELMTAVEPTIFFMGFNMLDPVIGGEGQRARLLRRAISIAVDMEEFISIFLNGRGVVAQSPLPPGIFGHRTGEAGINPFVYRWEAGRAVRRSLDEARTLMVQAGYPGGRDRDTGRALTLNYEAVATGPDDRARLNWLRKQFAKLGIELVIRSTDYNRFQDKIRNGTGQIFFWGWNADYPDPENFLFLLYGPNGRVEHQGENSVNYTNPEFDRLFERMRNLEDGPERQALIDRMVEIARTDAPWIWGFHPRAFSLYHRWYHNAYPNQMANNTLKYRRIDPALRAELRRAWNQPVLWPLGAAAAVLLALLLPAWWLVRRRERSRAL